MILGIGVGVVGYAIFYWGLQHFSGMPGIDSSKRYSLLTLLGVPKSWGFTKGQPVGLTSTTQSNQTQGQNAENTTTPNNLTGGGGNWIGGILSGIGAPGSNNNVNKLNAWNYCEGNLPGASALGLNNPFNITPDSYQPATQGDLPDHIAQGGVHLSSFSTITLGIAGNVAKLQEPFASAIKANLVNDGSFNDFANAVGSSGWGTSGSCIASSGSQVSTA